MTMTRRFLLTAAASTIITGNPARAAMPERLWEGFRSPVGMGFDAAGNLYITEWSAGWVSRIAPDGSRSTFADGLSGPSGLAVGPEGMIYVASYSSDVVWRFTPDGQRSTHIIGLATPAGLSFDRAGRLMIANRRTDEILTVEDGRLVPVIGGLRTPVGAVQTPDGGYVVSNIGGGVTIIRPNGTRVEAGQDFTTPGPGIVQTRDGRVFVADYGGTTVREILMSGGSQVLADGFSSPVGLVVSPDGRALLAADWGNGAVWRIPLG
ncbi:hypothetical protein D2T31_02645 [Sinirhodobacter populi]|uniref:Serine/threonine protein kinase n=1 Tax=Paenirhodobacter populi TaxID=2306993 RepID=A0A443KGK7_9RHOB|nr:NHL repeat-containing protein [Sinirhodobacter populi]RWR31885.1 hypothetical protein D2T31_02645 [Sinirhodobacter populi]